MDEISFIVPVALVVLALGVVYRQISQQLGVIHTLVNSNLSKVQADLTVALQRIESLEGALKRERN